MRVSAHVRKSDDIHKRCVAYGYPSVKALLRAVAPEYRGDPGYPYAIEARDLNPSLQVKRTGHSTGSHLVAIVRGGKVCTILNADNMAGFRLDVRRVFQAP